jgi:hypothetical protein
VAEHECTERMRAVGEWCRCDVTVTETPQDDAEPSYTCRHDVPVWILPGIVAGGGDAAP